MHTLEDDVKTRFRMKRYMDDVITITAKDDSVYTTPLDERYLAKSALPEPAARRESQKGYECSTSFGTCAVKPGGN